MHQDLNKTKAQIKAINSLIKEGKVKNVYAAKNKVKTLKKWLKIATDNYNWENYLSN
jgi:hypothetical protein